MQKSSSQNIKCSLFAHGVITRRTSHFNFQIDRARPGNHETGQAGLIGDVNGLARLLFVLSFSCYHFAGKDISLTA